jgi:hypothetical protein
VDNVSLTVALGMARGVDRDGSAEKSGWHWLCQCNVDSTSIEHAHRHSMNNGSPGSCCRAGASKYQVATDHFQSTVLLTSTGCRVNSYVSINPRVSEVSPRWGFCDWGVDRLPGLKTPATFCRRFAAGDRAC